MTAQYYKLPWPEPLVPEGEPHWFYYEVVDGCVLRLVDEMEQGELNEIVLRVKMPLVPHACR